jgi:hypothetical protein
MFDVPMHTNKIAPPSISINIATLLNLVSPCLQMHPTHLKFWAETFPTTIFLINLLPTEVLNFATPTEKVLNITPNYTPFVHSVVLTSQISTPTTNANSLFILCDVFFLG